MEAITGPKSQVLFPKAQSRKSSGPTLSPPLIRISLDKFLLVTGRFTWLKWWIGKSHGINIPSQLKAEMYTQELSSKKRQINEEMWFGRLSERRGNGEGRFPWLVITGDNQPNLWTQAARLGLKWKIWLPGSVGKKGQGCHFLFKIIEKKNQKRKKEDAGRTFRPVRTRHNSNSF